MDSRSDAAALVNGAEAVARAFRAADAPETAYATLAHEACRLLGWTRCSVFLRSADTGAYVGRLGYRLDRPDPDHRVAQLTCATPADGFAREVLESRRPVLVADAVNDPRPVRFVVRQWHVRTILGVPLLVGDDVVGMLFLDDEDTLRDYDPAKLELAASFGRLAGLLLDQAARDAERRTASENSTRQLEHLRHHVALHERLAGLVRDGASLWDLARITAALTGNPCVIQDDDGRVIAMHRRPGAMVRPPRILDDLQRDIPEVERALAALEPFTPKIVGPNPANGLMHRLLVTDIVVTGRRRGRLAIAESGRRFASADLVTSRVAAQAIAMQLAVEERATAYDEHAREALVRDVLSRPTGAAPPTRQAKLLGLRPSGPHVVALAADRTGAPLPGLRWLQNAWAARGSPHRLWATSMPHGELAAIIELDEAAPQRAAVAAIKGELDELVRGADQPVLLSLSSGCAGPDDFRRCFDEAAEVLRVMRAIGGDGSSTLTADDLGAGRLLLGSVDPAQAESFVASSLGPLLEDGVPDNLLLTLHAFSESSNQLRSASKRLEIHENTVRNRLLRVTELTGLDVMSDPSARLTAQVALLILRIQGRLPPG